MPKRVLDTNAVRARLGEILDEAYYRGSEFVIQRRGKPLAAIISYAAYEQLARRREAAFRVFHEIWDGSRDAGEAEVAGTAERAVVEVRRERHRRRGRT